MDDLEIEQRERQLLHVFLDDHELILDSRVSHSDIFNPQIERLFIALKSLVEKGITPDKNELINIDGKISTQIIKEVIRTKANKKNIEAYESSIIEASKIRAVNNISLEIGDNIREGMDASKLINAIYASLDKLEITTKSSELSASDLEEQFKLDVLNRGNAEKGIMTNIRSINQWTGGFRAGEFIVIGAFTNDGKSMLMMNFAATMTSNGVPCCIITLEDSAQKYRDRMLSFFSGINYRVIKDRDVDYLSNEDNNILLASQERFKTLPLWIDGFAGMSIGKIESAARKMVKQHGIRVLFIDYIQIIHNPGFKSEREKIMDTTVRLTNLCRNLGIVLITPSQLNRSGKDKPHISQLSESSKIEHQADYIFLIEATTVQIQGEEARVPTKIIMGKGRDVAKGLYVNIKFDRERLSFNER